MTDNREIVTDLETGLPIPYWSGFFEEVGGEWCFGAPWTKWPFPQIPLSQASLDSRASTLIASVALCSFEGNARVLEKEAEGIIGEAKLATLDLASQCRTAAFKWASWGSLE